jgi:hypothetical protein
MLNLPDPDLTQRFQDVKATIELVEATALKGVEGKSIDELDEATFILKTLSRQISELPTALVLLRRAVHSARMEVQGKD